MGVELGGKSEVGKNEDGMMEEEEGGGGSTLLTWKD